MRRRGRGKKHPRVEDMPHHLIDVIREQYPEELALTEEPIELLKFQLEAVKLPPPVREYPFAAPRKWRFDAVWISARVALEIEGGVWARKGAKRCPTCGQIPRGRHTSGAGFEGDIEKYNMAALLNWRLIRVTPEMIKDGRALRWLEEALRWTA